jgi:prepilin-type N-terminal cleavage/methylation domain-containing protein
MNVQNKEKGFTIIEVVLVLAIAGLIFLMVFIALPALQRNQRDTARKNDVSVVAAAVTSYTSNNRGTFPTATQLGTYLNDLSDNSSKAVTVNTTAVVGTNIAPADSLITIVRGKSCGAVSNTGAVMAAGTTRQFAVVTKLESGNGQYFCQTS